MSCLFFKSVVVVITIGTCHMCAKALLYTVNLFGLLSHSQLNYIWVGPPSVWDNPILPRMKPNTHDKKNTRAQKSRCMSPLQPVIPGTCPTAAWPVQSALGQRLSTQALGLGLWCHCPAGGSFSTPCPPTPALCSLPLPICRGTPALQVVTQPQPDLCSGTLCLSYSVLSGCWAIRLYTMLSFTYTSKLQDLIGIKVINIMCNFVSEIHLYQFGNCVFQKFI